MKKILKNKIKKSLNNMNKAYYIALDDEIILDIHETYDDMMGYCIKTNYQNIYFLIENVDICCESFGVDFYKEDDTLESCDHECILDFSFLINKKLKEIIFLKSGEGDIVYRLNIDDTFFNIKVYNYHNGYYTHKVSIKYGSYSDDDYL
jgi:hypothetical protein